MTKEAQLPIEFQESPKKKDGMFVNPKRIVSDLIRFWFVFPFAIAATMGIAYLVNRYSPKVYLVRGSVLIKDNREFQGPEILYNNPIVNEYRNYYNELYILRSAPVIEEVIKKLGFQTSFLKEGNIKTSELYNMLPLTIDLSTEVNSNGYFYLKILNDKQYFLASFNGNTESTAKKSIYDFGKKVTLRGTTFEINIENDHDLESYLNQTYILQFTQARAVAMRYVRSLRIRWSEPGSSVLELSIEGFTPAKEVDFIGGLIEAFSQRDLDRKNEMANRSISFIQSQLEIMQDSLRAMEFRLENFKSANFSSNLTREASTYYYELSQVQEQLAELGVRETYYKYLISYMLRNDNYDQILLPSSASIQEGVINGLITKLITLQFSIKSLNRDIKEQNPMVGNIGSEISDVRKSIFESIRVLRQTDSLKTQNLNLKAGDIKDKLKEIPRTERELNSIERSYNLIESTYLFLMQKYAEVGISRASTTSDIVVINPPSIIGGPVQPQPLQNYLFAFGIGLVLPVLFFALKEAIDNRIQSKEDIERITALPISGTIGHNKTSKNVVVGYYPRSSISEEFRSLRSNLNYFITRKEKMNFLITSSVANEGKTFTSINLGLVFSLVGKKTLLIGADLRKPRIYDDFGLSNETGLSNYLIGAKTFDEIVQDTEYEDLNIVASGPVPPNPSELIMRDAMQNFIEEAQKKYDILIFDSPPLTMVTDGFILSSLCDHTIFIIRQNFTHYRSVLALQKWIDEGKLGSISLVLNDIKNFGPGYGYGYGHGYGYGYKYFGYRYGKNDGDGYYED